VDRLCRLSSQGLQSIETSQARAGRGGRTRGLRASLATQVRAATAVRRRVFPTSSLYSLQLAAVPLIMGGGSQHLRCISCTDRRKKVRRASPSAELSVGRPEGRTCRRPPVAQPGTSSGALVFATFLYLRRTFLYARIALLLRTFWWRHAICCWGCQRASRRRSSWGRAVSPLAGSDRLCMPLKLGPKTILIPVDTLLPRVTTLALSATTRQTKVAACELLHACVLMIVGHIHEVRGNRSQHSALFKRLVGPCLRLAIDAESVASQLLRASNAAIRVLLLPVRLQPKVPLPLLMLLSTPLSAATPLLRNLAAKRFGEFVSWTVKHDQATVE